MNTTLSIGNIISWIFGFLVMAVGAINTFWGNDFWFGIFLMLLAFVYFPPVTVFVRKRFGIAVPLIAKIALAIFIIWAAFGVGELFLKIDMMRGDLG